MRRIRVMKDIVPCSAFLVDVKRGSFDLQTPVSSSKRPGRSQRLEVNGISDFSGGLFPFTLRERRGNVEITHVDASCNVKRYVRVFVAMFFNGLTISHRADEQETE